MHGQQQAIGVWQCMLQVAAGCRCVVVHEQQQQAAVHVLQRMSSSSSRLTCIPSKADLQQTISSEEKHSPNTRSSLRFTKAIGPGDRDMSTEQDIRRCAVRPSFLEPREPVDVRWIRREKLPRTRPFTRDEKAALNIHRCFADLL
ncbi:hypothetical protein QJQ45_018302 [Haematococcus lacustris]|nr:hypothetical protein QJQ45_018302 [Haematococcus lacustris]